VSFIRAKEPSENFLLKVAISIERKFGLRGIFALSLCSVLATGCSSTVTTPSPVAPVAVIDTDKTVPQAPVPGAGLALNGQYPGFNGPLLAAGPQMSDEEALGLAAEMEALSKRKRSGTVSEAAYNKRMAELQTLARNHGSDTVKEIQK
jgi:hypothetical protein